MLRALIAAAALVLAAPAAVTGRGSEAAGIEWQRSASLGLPWDGRLRGGIELPAEGRHFFTWDPIRKRVPNRAWRRHGSERLLRVLIRVIAQYRAANPGAPRVAIGDLSRPGGGEFGRRYGGLGHASHQNGLDADIYYPRRDRRELGPRDVRQVDRRLAQDLVDRFVRAGAEFVFVGPSTGLRGPRDVVQALAYHDEHMHVRIRGDRAWRVVARRGRRVLALRLGEPAESRRVLVIGCFGGGPCGGGFVVRALAVAPAPRRGQLWLVRRLPANPRLIERVIRRVRADVTIVFTRPRNLRELPARVIELPPGRPTRADVDRYARALLALAE